MKKAFRYMSKQKLFSCVLWLLIFMPALQAQDSIHFHDRWEKEFDTIFDSGSSLSSRVRGIDEIARWGHSGLSERLGEALDDESSDIRIATLRALMRLGVDQNHERISGIVTSDKTSSKELAWALRALGRSDKPRTSIPLLIQSFQNSHSGVRMSALESLRKLTGFTQGAHERLLIPLKEAATEEETNSYLDRWKTWWHANQDSTPEEWRLQALQAEEPKTRAGAARAIAEADQTSAIPELLAQLRQEGLESYDGASGVRQAIAEALGSLTGYQLDYQAYQKQGSSQKEWQEEHLQAIQKWEDFYHKIVREEGKRPLLELLSVDDARSRAHALRLWRKQENILEHPLERYVELLNDSAKLVRYEAYGTLTSVTGLHWPYDPDEDEGLRKLQVARWRDWVEVYKEKPEEGVLSAFFKPSQMHWGRKEEALEADRQKCDQELLAQLPSIQSLAALHIATKRMQLSPYLLLEAFKKELERCRKLVAEPLKSEYFPKTGLEYNLLLAFGALQSKEALPLILERIALAGETKILELPQASSSVLKNLEVQAACIQALGEILEENPSQIELAPVRSYLYSLFDGSEQEGSRLRIQALYALARIKDQESYDLFEKLLFQKQSLKPLAELERYAALESMGMITERLPGSFFYRTKENLEQAQTLDGVSQKFKLRARELLAILKNENLETNKED